MALDPRISLGVQPLQIADPLAQYGKVAAIQQAQNQNALAQYQLSAAQRADEQAANRLRVFQEAGGDPARVRNALLQTGDIEGYTKLTKGETEAGKTRAETIAKHMALSKERLATVRTPEDYLAWHQANHADPVLNEYFKPLGITAESQNAKIIQQLQQPGGFENLFKQSALGLEKSMEQVLTSQNLGRTTQVLSTPKYAMPGAAPQATVVPGSVQQMTMAPGEAEQIAIARGQLGVSQGQLELARQKERRIADTGEGTELAPKEIQKREAAFPKATSAVKGFENEADKLIRTLQELRDHPGLNKITGLVGSKTLNLSDAARRAQALYDNVVAKGQFQTLQDLRNSSPTGGALGSVSDKENQTLRAAFAAINQDQSTADIKNTINQVIEDVKGSKQRIRDTYDMTYEYKNRGGTAAPAPAAPGAPKAGTVQDGYRFKGGNPADPKSWEKL